MQALVLFWVLACHGLTHALRPNAFLGTQHARASSIIKPAARTPNNGCILQPTLSGYLPLDLHPTERGEEPIGSLYYAYFERQHTPAEDEGEAPIILWLQGGPGCASTFGLLYEMGPYWVNQQLCLEPNPGAWTQFAALLIIDQPLGTGLSFVANASHIPRDEMSMATHLYTALQQFFTQHWRLRHRPLFITGESYGGKYVPSIAHFILQAQQQAGHAASATALDARPCVREQTPPALKHLRQLPQQLPRPNFKLAGIAVGNGLTAPREQTQQLALAAWWAGVMDTATAQHMQDTALQVVSLIDSQRWEEAHTLREDLRSNITAAGGLATMFDTRRTLDYDPHQLVDEYYNNADVRDAMGAKHEGKYITCSDEVGSAMAGDVMQSVVHLVPDILQHIPVLLYQGQFDILDGPASNARWIEAMDWPLKEQFNQLPSTLWECPGGCQLDPDAFTSSSRSSGSGSSTSSSTSSSSSSGGGSSDGAGVTRGADPHGEWGSRGVGGRQHAQRGAGLGKWTGKNSSHIGGWWRQAGRLTHAVVYRAGHMVPHDQPLAMRHLLSSWVIDALHDQDDYDS